MLLGDSAFSAAAFSAYPDTNFYIGLTGMQLQTALNRVQVETPFNFNVTIFPDGSAMVTNINGLTAWVDVDTLSTNIWTEIAT
jgi:hypothetical protein